MRKLQQLTIIYIFIFSNCNPQKSEDKSPNLQKTHENTSLVIKKPVIKQPVSKIKPKNIMNPEMKSHSEVKVKKQFPPYPADWEKRWLAVDKNKMCIQLFNSLKRCFPVKNSKNKEQFIKFCKKVSDEKTKELRELKCFFRYQKKCKEIKRCLPVPPDKNRTDRFSKIDWNKTSTDKKMEIVASITTHCMVESKSRYFITFSKYLNKLRKENPTKFKNYLKCIWKSRSNCKATDSCTKQIDKTLKK